MMKGGIRVSLEWRFMLERDEALIMRVKKGEMFIRVSVKPRPGHTEGVRGENKDEGKVKNSSGEIMIMVQYIELNSYKMTAAYCT